MREQLTAADMQDLMGRSLFQQLLRPEVLAVRYDPLELELKLPMHEGVERQPGTDQWHGGALSAIIDMTGCYALALLIGEPPPTINFRSDYLRPAIDSDLTALARVRRAGRTVGVVDVDITDNARRLIAVGRATYSLQGGLTPR